MNKKILLIITAIIILAAIAGTILWQMQRNKVPFLAGKSIPINNAIEANLAGE
ncbi:hypothetical protein HZC21_01590 [Candidatus Peregrinibacteria bacterium]|nr:hypothetical protein [Candidatus Peregrinibacteria bacterium]